MVRAGPTGTTRRARRPDSRGNSPATARAFASVHAELATEPPGCSRLSWNAAGQPGATGVRRLTEAVRMGRHLRGLRGTDVEA